MVPLVIYKYTVCYLLYVFIKNCAVDVRNVYFYLLKFLELLFTKLFLKLFYTEIVVLIRFCTVFTLHSWHMFFIYLDVKGEMSRLMIVRLVRKISKSDC